MRWALLTAAVMAVLVLGGYARLLERVDAVAAVRQQLEAVREAVARGDWAAAERAVAEAERAWRRAQGVVAVLSAHGDLVQFEVQLAQLAAAVRNRSATDADLAADAALALWARLVAW